LIIFFILIQKKDDKPESDLKEANPIEKAEKDFFKIVEEEKSKRNKKMV
jgi:hypothetical protein